MSLVASNNWSSKYWFGHGEIRVIETEDNRHIVVFAESRLLMVKSGMSCLSL